MAKLKVNTGQSAGIRDFFRWERFTSLQKLLSIVVVVIVISWLFSLWTIFLFFSLCTAGALKLSNEISHHETGPLLADSIILKLEEAYVWSCNILYTLNKSFNSTDCNHDVNDRASEHKQIEDDSSLFTENDSDKLFDSSSSANIISELVRSELNSLQLLIIRDFVQSWYSAFSYNNQFLRESKYSIQQSCNNIAVSLSHQNLPCIVTSLLKIVRVHITMYSKAKAVFDTHQIHPKTKVPKDSIKRYISVEEAFEKEFGFHEALSTDETEVNYLRGIMSIIILSAFPKPTTEGICTRTLLVEIITNKAFLPLIQMMSDPEWLMDTIILLTSNDYIDKGENEQKQNTDISSEFEETLTNISPDNYHCQEEISDIRSPLYSGENNDTLQKEKVQIIFQQTSIDDDAQRNEDEKVLLDEEITEQCVISKDETLLCSKNSLNKNDVVVENDYERSSTQDENNANIKNSTPNCIQEHVSLSANDSCDKTAELKHVENSSPECVKKEESILNLGQKSDIMLQEEDFKSVSSTLGPESNKQFELTDSYEQVFLEGEANPQNIISYNKSDLVPSPIPSPSSPSMPSESTSSSFPKFSSLKNFLVDSFKTGNKNSGVQKPKTLELFQHNITSTLNPLSKSRSSSLNKEVSPSNSSNSSPPVVLVDGKPAEGLSPSEKNSFKTSHPPISANGKSTTIVDRGEQVSPGFFSSIHPFFFRSSSQSDLSVSNLNILEESPVITPSPTDAHVFDLESSGNLNERQNGGRVFDFDQCMSKSIMAGDLRIFQDISIPLAITNQEFRSSSQYSLYVIEYDAYFFNDEGKSVFKSGVVKRRHREFTNLQSRLDSHPSFKKYLKKIRGPRRWPTLPFKSLDKETVETRRQFLEKYLKDLISVEAICNGSDMREFLAYEGDSHIAFVRKSPDISVPRLDKMLMRGMSEVVDKLKSIPNIPSEVMSGLRSKESLEDKSVRPTNQFDADAMEVNTVFDKQGVQARGSVLNVISHQLTYDHDNSMKDDYNLFDMSIVIKDLKSYERTQETYRQEVDKVLSSLSKVKEQKGTETQEDRETAQRQSTNMTPVLLELLVQGLQGRNHRVCQEQVVKLLQAFFGKALNSFMMTSIKDLTSESQLVIYLRLLRETVWPQGQLWSDSNPPRTEEEKTANREKAKKSLNDFFPVLLRKCIGEDDFGSLLEVYISCLHCPKLNRHLLYHLLDFLAEQLFPEASSCQMLQTLLFSSTSTDGYP